MGILILFFIFFFGLAIGSFLNCLIYRLENKKSFLTGRSFCPQCRHMLSWRDLIPIFSFLILKGKCRYCQKTISWQYPLVELFTGIVFLFVVLTFNDIFTILYLLVISCFLILIFVYDLKHYIIPDKVIYPAILLSFLYQGIRIFNFAHWNLLQIRNLGLSILPTLFFFAIVFFSKEKLMGWGDVKMVFLMGLLLSFPSILIALFLAFFFGSVIGLGLVILKKKTLKSKIPFGPFLVCGTFLALFFYQRIINCYFALFSLK